MTGSTRRPRREGGREGGLEGGRKGRIGRPTEDEVRPGHGDGRCPSSFESGPASALEGLL